MSDLLKVEESIVSPEHATPTEAADVPVVSSSPVAESKPVPEDDVAGEVVISEVSLHPVTVESPSNTASELPAKARVDPTDGGSWNDAVERFTGFPPARE